MAKINIKIILSFLFKICFNVSVMKKEIITINGTLGSGKSSTADRVAKELGYKRFSSGDFFRKIGLELGISLNEVSTKAEVDKEIDRRTDQELQKLNSGNKIVIDSRLAFHWIPDSFKVYLDLPPEIAKERILHDLKTNPLREKSEKSETAEEVYQKMTDRLESEKKRYQYLYGVDHTDKRNFDLVIDTNQNNLDEVVKIIVTEYKKWLKE
jgi:CMP/dCMP kinase